MIAGAVDLLSVLALLGSGLIAGVFFAFSAFVMTALGRLPPQQGIAAMQSINLAVLNPWFLGVFLGTAAACLLLAGHALFDWSAPGAGYRLAGALLYLLGSFLVTVAFNVPLNRELAAVEAGSQAAPGIWARYRSGWSAWNHARTVASLAAAAALLPALALGAPSGCL